MKNILLLTGGGGSEHEIAITSSQFIESQIDSSRFNVYKVEINKQQEWTYQDKPCSLTFDAQLKTSNDMIQIAAAIPCFHGYPGETGDIQSFFELIKLPYVGCNAETSVLCFNKLVTKMFLETSGVKTTPFLAINSVAEMIKANIFFNEHKSVFVKATNQGSSVGCYKVNSLTELKSAIENAFDLSPFVILEKEIIGRELEVAAYFYNDKFHLSSPGEIICEDEFYTYEEKYSQQSKTITQVKAKNIDDSSLKEIERQANIAIDLLKIRHLARIDFFLTSQGDIFINEINTFPGHTQISMFPQMMEQSGVKYSSFINNLLDSLS
ncbi:MAG: D-alanine--D-alanine ligase [Halobacteriovoraceae bacterium]|jgi:D-alanine-D-alanine ligase|nr:D-alanine--D-alanine ligase [Halobacteriovoraceae bacterium]